MRQSQAMAGASVVFALALACSGGTSRAPAEAAPRPAEPGAPPESVRSLPAGCVVPALPVSFGGSW
jgi:hypothetical protein